jgi:hypothetical protein
MLKRILHYHPALTFLIMALSILIAGLSATRIFFLFDLHIALVREHGIQALMSGALQQFFELIVSGFLVLFAYIIFTACETILVKKITD